MKRFYFFTLLFITICTSVLGADKTYTVDNIPKVRLQNKMRYVSDPENILSLAARDSIDRMLYQLEQKTGIETVVIVVPSIGNEECFDFSHNVLNKWGVGKKEASNGLVILLVTDQRCVQFYTGYGLEGDLPDAICKRIQTQDMIPYLRNGDWNQGMVAGIRAVCQHLDGTAPVVAESEDDDAIWITLLFMGIIVIATMVSLFVEWIKSRCPKCGKHKLQRTSSLLISQGNGVKIEDVTYTCRNCGEKVIRRQRSTYDNNHGRGRGGGGPIIGGGFGRGGGFGGGGFGGGSFGGGSGGGGGAGSRF